MKVYLDYTKKKLNVEPNTIYYCYNIACWNGINTIFFLLYREGEIGFWDNWRGTYNWNFILPNELFNKLYVMLCHILINIDEWMHFDLKYIKKNY